VSCERRGRRSFRDSEVEHLRRAIRTNLDVRRLQIAMDDAPFVRGVEGIGDLPGDPARLVDRHRAVQKEIGERRPFDEFQHERAQVPVGVGRPVNAVDRGDVLMIERREQVGFTLEAGEAIGIARELAGQHLDRNVAAE
jgi:hypothetical protein